MWSTLQDKFGFRPVYLILMSIQLCISVSIYYVRKDPVLYVIWVAGAFLCEGGHFSMFPTACVKLFGIQQGGLIFTVMFLITPVSSLLGLLIVETGGKNVNELVFFVAGALTLTNIILLYFYKDEEIKSKETLRWEELH